MSDKLHDPYDSYIQMLHAMEIMCNKREEYVFCEQTLVLVLLGTLLYPHMLATNIEIIFMLSSCIFSQVVYASQLKI